MNKGKAAKGLEPSKANKPGPPNPKKQVNKKEIPPGARFIPLAEEPPRDWAAKTLSGGAWPLVDAEAQREIGRRRPPKALVERANQIADILEREFPNARCALHYSTPLELLVATILSAQCTDVRVNEITPELYQIYRSPEDFAASPAGELEEAIRSAGFFNNKARSIRSCCRELLDRHNGEVPARMEELSALSGVGRKTASVIRANAFGLPGITVDTQYHPPLGAAGPDGQRRSGSNRIRPWFVAGARALVAIQPRADPS